jgi:RimJ/RimL family protein N-acetyltransferase
LGIRYSFKEEYWHKGYATEAALGCRRYAFQTLKAESIFNTKGK